ncbi:hypothetical protein [Bradyrhizobium guangzhouense]|uniref:Sulfur globule protein n=1 Tax=Bradyrhizobium guangzhouense TaxID=1325095 RepID=A0AAE5WWC8_9BRAD|nr:hypothetical protein [Bradyrhizobium guangzhouense]QAU44271.1 hypothetical protein XH91_02135 [Bradyrhizobium guangzhouense]RXH05385.1 hypothetical protein EAS56_35685 [Bradyrhizobium guangzhouense]
MLRIMRPRTSALRLLGLAAVAVLMLSSGSARRAEAMTPVNPTALPAAKAASDDMMIQVHGGGHGGFHGGGGHFGGFHGGGGHFGGFHGGGYHYGGFHRFGGYGGYHRHWGGYYRPYYGYRHFHRRYYYGGYYPAYHYPRRCRIIWTYYGPRRICHWHRWHYPYRYW